VSDSIATSFDFSPRLVALNLGQNQLSGSLPLLNGSRALIKIDMSYNHFNGTVPLTWSQLTSLQGCYLQHNDLESPFDVQLGSLPSLLTLDLSYNRLTSKVSDPTQNGQAGAAIAFGIGPALRSINLAYNQISGNFESGYLSQKRSVVNLNVAGNRITSFPLDIFGALGNPFPPANTLPNIQTIDFSYNNMSWTPRVALESPLDNPPVSLLLLRIQGLWRSCGVVHAV
jgi:Leucine-rich repeat (LRR) protein